MPRAIARGTAVGVTKGLAAIPGAGSGSGPGPIACAESIGAGYYSNRDGLGVVLNTTASINTRIKQWLDRTSSQHFGTLTHDQAEYTGFGGTHCPVDTGDGIFSLPNGLNTRMAWANPFTQAGDNLCLLFAARADSVTTNKYWMVSTQRSGADDFPYIRINSSTTWQIRTTDFSVAQSTPGAADSPVDCYDGEWHIFGIVADETDPTRFGFWIDGLLVSGTDVRADSSRALLKSDWPDNHGFHATNRMDNVTTTNLFDLSIGDFAYMDVANVSEAEFVELMGCMLEVYGVTNQG